MSLSTQTKSVSLVDIDNVIHERARLGIMSLLVATGELVFVELKRHLGMTDGNLSVHLRILEEAGYVGMEKEIVGRKPRTTVRVTRRGRAAFKGYIDVLERIVRKVKG